MNKKLFPECHLPVTIHELVAKFSCFNTENCMNSKCSECSSTKLSSDNFNTRSTSDSDLMSLSDVSDINGEDENVDEDSISYYEWVRCEDNKLQKVLFKTSIDKSIRLLHITVKTLKRHIQIKRVQFNFYNDAKNSLTKSEVLIHADYSESYENKQKREIRSVYFGQALFSIFTACCMICESVTITDYSRAAAMMSVLTVIGHLREKNQHLSLKINPIVWSDGCSPQFRSRFVFKLLSSTDSSLNITWCYNERHHGKGPMDGIGGTLRLS